MFKKSGELVTFIITAIFIMIFSCTAYANVEKIWEMPVEDLFTFGPDVRIRSAFELKKELHPDYIPAVVQDKLVFGSVSGVVSLVDPETKAVEYVARVPISVERAENVGRSQVLFFGRHIFTGDALYCTVDFRLKRVIGLIKKDIPLRLYQNWFIYNRGDVFFVLNPRTGGVFHVQSSDYFANTIIPTEEDQYYFESKEKSIIEMILPKWGITAMFHSVGGESKRSMLKFYDHGKLNNDKYPDLVTRKETILYHLPDKTIGHWSLKRDKMLWESSIIKKDLEILKPMISKNLVVYLLAKSAEDRSAGYLLCFNKRNGKAKWVTRPFAFEPSFEPVRFFNSVVGADGDNNIAFLDYRYGTIKKSFPSGKPIAKPVVVNESIFIHNTEILYRFDDTSTWQNKIRMWGMKVKGLFD